MPMTQNHFTTLGLKAGATEDEIKKAYRNLAKKWHPDKNKEVGAEEKFKEISAAYEYLKSEDRRDILTRDLNKPRESKTKFESTSHNKNGYSSYSSYSSANTEEPSSYSRKFGQTSDDRYRSSTFGSFADEGRDRYSRPKMPGHKTKKQSKPQPRKPWNQDWNNMDDLEDEIYDNVPYYSANSQSRPNFSFAFKSFVDDLGMNFDTFFTSPNINMFEFSSFFTARDPFTDFTDFCSHDSGTPFSMDGVYRRQRPRNVAEERGANGIDPDYVFTPQFKNPSRTQSAHSMRADTTTASDDDMDSRWFKCTYCTKRMPFSMLSSHEPGCALRNRGRFDQSDNEEDYEFSPEEDQYPQNTGDWRQTHEELLRSIRRAKQASKTNGYRSGSATTRGTTEDSPQMKTTTQIHCQWCGRNFSHPAAKQHIPFCEKWTKEHGTPLNPVGKSAARDAGSKSHRAREYAKHIPRPRDKSKDSESPNSPRNHFDHFPDIGTTKRETLNKAGVSSGTGLHTSDSYSPRDSKPYTPKPSTSKTSTRTHSGKYSSQNTDKPFTSPMEDNYSFNISGTKLKTDNHSKHTETCNTCKKRIRGHARLTCNCGIRKKGA